MGKGDRKTYNSFKMDAGKTGNSNMAVPPLLSIRDTVRCLTIVFQGRNSPNNMFNVCCSFPFMPIISSHKMKTIRSSIIKRFEINLK